MPLATPKTRAVASALAAGIATATIGIAALYVNAKNYYPGFGYQTFIMIPLAAGFAVAIIARPRLALYLGLGLTLLFAGIGLYLIGLEGLLCMLFALPLILPGMAIGAITACAVSWFAQRSRTKTISLLLVIALVPVANAFDRGPVALNTIITTVSVDTAPELIWPHLLTTSISTTNKPLLFRLGLPTPTRCALENEGIGAVRTCYFEGGYIREVVSDWYPPYRLGLRIIETELPGRKWLGFETATFELSSTQGQTQIVRTTRISSVLRPRWYWAVLEQVAVEAQHEYVLDDIASKAIMGGSITRH